VNTNFNQPIKPPKRRCVLVCQNRSCVRNGSEEVLAAFQAVIVPGVFATGSDCMGQCASGPTVQVMPDGMWYCRIKPSDVPVIVEQHLQGDRPVEALLHPRFHPKPDAFIPSELGDGRI
jgi:(2Fe-2S) ferredoxin